EHGSRRGTTSFQVTELRRQRRRTTEEPIFTRVQTEEPKEVGGGGGEIQDYAKTKSIGEKNRRRYRARGSRSTKN
ncbi:unnamed protein product, partial [Brassica oleracea]